MASTNFRVFNEANASANTYNDSEYQNATQRQTGVMPGMAISRMHNKMYFQWSSMATAIAQYLVSRGYDCNDNDIAGIVSALENSCGLNIRQDSTEYAVGDIAYSAALSSVLYLECTTAGATASSIPVALTDAAEGDSITDGTVVWIVRKIASMADLRAASPGQRQASTSYEVDNMASLGSLPYGWYLECTTAGITSSGDLVITSPNVGGTVTDGTVVWTIRKVADTTDATTTTHGLMSASDKTKLNGIEANANKYTLPAASGSALGGVKIGSNITNSGGTISLSKVNVTSALGYTPPTTNTTYGTGTASTSGITKLYTGVGDNTDGSMTQKAIKAIVGTGGGIVAASLATNGYVKFANGFCVQWGKITSGSNQTDREVIFPVAFNNACYGVIQQRLRSAQTGSKYGNYFIPYIVDKTKCFLWVDDLPSLPVGWIAYGA